MLSTAGWYLGVAFVVMQVVEVVLPFTRLPNVTGSIVLGLLAVGFPVALVLSWVLQITPPRFRRELPRDEALALESIIAPENRAMRPDSLAVIPFVNLTAEESDEYFSDGITDDVIAAVAHIKGLRVLSRTSSMQFKGVSRSVRTIGTQLGVATVVMGSVRRSGSRVRVIAEVVDARSDDHLWAETYDRELDDIFEVQTEIATKVAEAVQRELPMVDRRRIEARGTGDAEAYDLYLRARYLWNQRTEAAVAESIRYFQRALERDPDFALAHAGLADANTVLGVYGAAAPQKVLERARTSAESALTLEPGLGEALTARACVRAVYDWDWTRAEHDFRRAIELAPSYPTAYQWYAANLLTPLGRHEEARGQLSLALDLDPASGAIATTQSVVTFYSRDFRAAAEEFERLAAIHPRFALVHLFLGQSLEQLGDHEAAIAAHRRAAEVAEESSETIAALGHCLAKSGAEAEAEAMLRRLRERSARSYVSPALCAQVLLGLGRSEEALDELEAAAGVRAVDLIWLGVRPVYDPLRETPRFRALEARIGLS